MAKGFNLAADDFEKKVIEDINQSGLPMKAIEKILFPIYIEVQTEARKAVEKDRQQFEAEEAKNNNGI